MNRHITYKITPSESGVTIEHFLKTKGYSKPIIVHLKKTYEGIVLNGVWGYMRTILNNGDILKVHIIETEPSENIVPSAITYEDFKQMIVYEDDDILVVNKTAALPVHPSKMHYENTLANYCAYYYQVLNPIDGEFVFRCVNRLDKDTSGLVIIAKNMLSSASLYIQQQDNEIHRTYLAIAEGIVPKNGIIDLPISKKEDSAIERCIDMANGDKAVTHYECIDTKVINGSMYSLVKLNLETGRTHQIRVHMKAIGHPLIGDFLYNPNLALINRQALHSYRLEFFHPISLQKLCFTQSPPSDFNGIFSLSKN
jgi:23S rRNA pseudouridine1911/1915/1917 synthase